MEETPMLSPEVLQLLAGVLDGLTLNVGADDFAEVAALTVQAKAELAAALAATADDE